MRDRLKTLLYVWSRDLSIVVTQDLWLQLITKGLEELTPTHIDTHTHPHVQHGMLSKFSFISFIWYFQ